MAEEKPTTSSGVRESVMDRRIARGRDGRRFRWAAIGLAGALVLVVGWFMLPAPGSTDIAAADIDTSIVQRAPFEDYVPVRATVTPSVTTLVDTITGGQVEKLLVQDGTWVNAGQPLATLANPTLKLEVLAREAEVAGQLDALTGNELALERSRLDRASQISSANYELLKARRDLSIHQQLHAEGFVSDEGVKTYQEEADYQQRRLRQLTAGEAREEHTASLQASRLADTRRVLAGDRDAVRGQLEALIVRAPTAGRLTNFTLQPGQMLKAGDSVGQVYGESSWKLVADVDEYYLGRVVVGQPVSGDRNARLEVTKVLPTVADGHFQVEAGFQGPPPTGLKRGQTIDIRITLGATADTLVAPVGGWLDSGGGATAFIVDAGGHHAHRRSIKIGRRNTEQVEIVSGLAQGDRIVTSNTSAIKADTLNIR